MKWLVSLLILLATQSVFAHKETFELTREERQFLQTHKVFSVHMERGYAPFSFGTGDSLSGYSIEYADLIAKKLGVSFRYTSDDKWDEALRKFKRKQIDIVAQMSDTRARRVFTEFTQSYMSYFQSLVVKKSNLDRFKTLNDMQAKTLGVVQGYAVQDKLAQSFTGIEIKAFEDTRRLIDAVMLGEVDGAIATYQVVQHYLTSNFITDIVSTPILNNAILPVESESFGVRKDYGLLRSAMDKAIDSLKLEKLKLQSKWFGEDTPKYVALSESERDFLNDFGSIRYCVDPTWKPLQYIDESGHHAGFSQELLAMLQSRSPIRFQLVHSRSWLESVELIKRKECDILPIAELTDSRAPYMEISSPYIEFPIVVATRSDHRYVERFEDIKDNVFAVVKGYSILEHLKIRYPSAHFIEVDNPAEGLQLVSSGKANGYLDSIAIISYFVAERGFTNVKVSAQLAEKVLAGIAVRSDLPQLLSVIEKHVSSLQPGEVNNLLNKFVSVRYQRDFDYSLFWKIGVVVLIVGAILLFRYRELSKLNKKIQQTNVELKLAKRELEQSLRQDYLTKLHNRKSLDEEIKKHFSYADSYKHSLGLIMLDIDHFKRVNDTFGHDVGDEVIRLVAATLKEAVREADIIGRWGGEEFMIISPDIDGESIERLAIKLNEVVSDTVFPTVGRVTVSLGAALLEPDESIRQFCNRADMALYLAKNNGRNCVEVLAYSHDVQRN